MTLEQMNRGIAAHREAVAIKAKFDGWVLLKADQYTKPEVVNVGEPVLYKKGEYHRTEIQIPEEIRRLAFRLWRKDLALKFNALIRELNQLGVSHAFTLIQFNPQTGDPA